MKRITALIVLALSLCLPYVSHAQLLQPTQPLDRIAAVVNDGVILQSKLDQTLAQVLHQYVAHPQQLPPKSILERQVLDRLILMKLQVQRAHENGIRVSDQELNVALRNVAARNRMTLDQLRQAIARQGGSFTAFQHEVNNQILVQKLRDSTLKGSVQVSQTEVNNLLASPLSKAGEVKLGQILITIPEGASPSQVSAAKSKAEKVAQALVGGMDFNAAAVQYSQAQNALEGGSVNWRRIDALPTALSGIVLKMKPGQITPPLRSPEGFYILKIESKRPTPKTIVNEYHARNILIRTTLLVNNTQAKAKLAKLRQQIIAGKLTFAQAAKTDSNDETTANLGGDMGWFAAGKWGSVIAKELPKLKNGKISPPLRVPNGWLIVQSLGSRQANITTKVRREQARRAIATRKAEESYRNFLRDLRAQAYIRILDPSLKASVKAPAKAS